MDQTSEKSSPALMDAVSPALAAAIIKAASTVRYDDGQMIHSRGDKRAGFSIIRSGAAKAGMYGVDGSFIMTSILDPGHSFGEVTIFTGLPRTHDLAAIGTTEIYQLTPGQFHRLAEAEPNLLKAVLQSALVRSHFLLERLDVVSRLPVGARVAHLLLSLTAADDTAARLQYRQSDLADTLGLSRVTLNRTLKHLATLGFIALGYARIDILDRARLTNWLAGFQT